MKQSLRAHRMERYHKRSKMQTKLSLVSLMDIFTILVFFLLVNSSNVEILQAHKSITLPESTAEQKPENNLMIMINSDSILVNGRKIADTGDVMLSDEAEIKSLRAELDYRAARQPFVNDESRRIGREITIMGSRDLPYSLLKKVMMTCAQTDYRNISLVVNRIAAEATAASVNGADMTGATPGITPSTTAVEG
jgi:biopolymer transport protein ExbD